MHKTPFAGLTAPDEGDPPLQVDGGTFATRNPDIIDHFLRIGAVTHRHDEHAPLADPLVGASAAVDITGGTIPAGRDLYIGYTLLDQYGGETRISPVLTVSTPPPLADPSTAITAAYASGVGDMVVGTYYYGITLVDSVGGETAMGPSVFVERPPGDPHGEINLSGLAAELGPDGGDHWRLWRADNGGAFHIIATGMTDTFTDNGINPTDLAAEPPATSETTRASNMVTVTLPDGTAEPGLDPAGVGSGFALYISDNGAFGSPSLYETLPLASAATPIVITTLDLLTGSPPDVSTSVPGAHKITAAELADDVSLGGGAGAGGFWPVRQAAALRPPEATWQIAPSATVLFATDVDHPYIGVWAARDDGNETEYREVYGDGTTSNYDSAEWRDDNTHFAGNGSGDLAITASGTWRIVMVQDSTGSGNWINNPVGGYVEVDYTINNDSWSTLSAEIVALSDITKSLRLTMDRAAGTMTLYDTAGAVIKSLGAADGFTPPASGTTGYMWLFLDGTHVFAFDARDTGSGYVAGPRVIDEELAAVGVLNQFIGGLRVGAGDPAAISVTYYSFTEHPIYPALHMATFEPDGSGGWMTQNFHSIWSLMDGGRIQPGDWIDAVGSGLASGWAVDDEALQMRTVSGKDEVQLIGGLSGAAASAAVIANIQTLNPTAWNTVAPGTPREEPVVLIASDGTRSTGYIRIDTTGEISLVQPAVPVDTVKINVTYPINNP